MPPAQVNVLLKSSTCFDHVLLESCFIRAIDRQHLLMERGGVDFSVIDLIDEEATKTYDRLVAELIREADETLALPEKSAMIARLVRYKSGTDVLAIFGDRRVLDPLSLCLFITDIKVLYEATNEEDLPPLEMQYHEYEMWRRHEGMYGESYAQQLAFWQRSLDKPLPRLELPFEYTSIPREFETSDSKRNKTVGFCQIPISSELADQLQVLAQKLHLPLRVFLLSAFHILLARYSGNNDIIVGFHISHRGTHVEMKNLLGSFENWVPVRVKSADHPSIDTFLKRVALAVADAESNPDINLDTLKKEIGEEGEEMFSAAFEVYGNTVDDYMFPLVSTRVLRLILGLYRSAEDTLAETEEYLNNLKCGSHNDCDNVDAVSDHSSSHGDTGEHGASENSVEKPVTCAIQATAKPLTIGGIDLEPILSREGTNNGDDDLRLVGVSSPLIRLGFQYNKARFSENTILRMTTHFVNIVKAMIAQYSLQHHLEQPVRISDIQLMLPLEENIVVKRFNENTIPLMPVSNEDTCVHNLVESVASGFPDKCAISALGEDVTYRELNEKANQLGNFLRLVGARRETLIPVILPRGAMLIIAWLGVLKSGAAIMPIDPAFPTERMRVMMNDAECTILVTNSELVNVIPESFQGRKIRIDLDWKRAIGLGSKRSPSEVSRSGNDETKVVDPHCLAYVLYTSGSTGKPKGVMLEHKSIVNYIRWHIPYYGMTSADRVFSCAGIGFDASMADTWPTLSIGATICPIVSPGVTVVAPKLIDWIVQQKVTMGFLTTQICEMFLEEDEVNPRNNGSLDCLRLVYTGGDRLHFGSRKDAPYSLVNIYGPTESTVNTTMCYVPRGLKVPPLIGAPAPNAQCYILDPNTLLPVPIGVFGELFIGGVQVARGYFKLPELTAEKFVTHFLPDGEGGRLYRTGDLARWLENGYIDFMGRKDTQVKIRGNRVELTAIESVLLQSEKIKDVVVVAREDTPGRKQLVAYFVPTEETETHSNQLVEEFRQFVSERLPSFMMPSLFVRMSRFPLTANHKVNRAALPTPSSVISFEQSSESGPEVSSNIKRQLQDQDVAPGSSILPFLKKTEKIFANVLGVDIVDSNVNFFEVGGDSLLVGRVTTQMGRLIGKDLPISLLYKFPTPLKFCQAVLVQQNVTSSEPVLEPVNHDDDFSVSQVGSTISDLQASYNEESMWLVCQSGNPWASRAYNIPFGCAILGKDNFLDPSRLLDAIVTVTRKSSALRATYVSASDVESEVVVEKYVSAIESVDFVQREFQEETKVTEWFQTETYKDFNFKRGPLFRVRIAVVPSLNKQYILFAVHHIISDLWSVVLTLDRIFGSYFGRQVEFEGEEDFKKFIRSQRDLTRSPKGKKMLRFWKTCVSEQLCKEEECGSMELPLDKPRPASKSFRGKSKLFRISKETSDQIHALCLNTGVTMNVCLLTAFNILLRTYSGSNNISVGIPTAGRNTPETEGLIGYFVNPIVMNTDLSGNPLLFQLLNRVAEGLLDRMDNQALPFPYLVSQLAKDNVIHSGGPGGENPLFNVAYVLQRPYLSRPGLAECMLGFHDVPLDLDENIKGMTSFVFPQKHSQFDVTLMVCFEEGIVSGSLHYNTDVFLDATASRMVEHFTCLLKNISACDPDKTRLAEISMMTESEYLKVTKEFSGWPMEFPDDVKNSCIHHLIERKARENPNKCCIEVRHGEQLDVLTYGQMEEKSNRLSNFLRFTGVRLETLVPVLLNRSANLTIAWLAVLKAGGVIMPMDPKYPTDRIRVMLDDLEDACCTVITESSLCGKIPESFSGRLVLIDDDWADAISLASADPSKMSEQQSSNSLAYAIYTSGSTGKPKGVLLEHRSIVNYMLWHMAYYEMTPDDRVFACAGIAFDASIADTWPTLAIGATLLPVVDPDISVVAPRLLDWIIAEKATLGFLTTQICEMVLEEDISNPRPPKMLENLRLLYTGGDCLHFGQRKNASYKLVNIYGPTENTVNSTMTFVEPGLKVPPLIGSPAPNTLCFILDPETLQPVPIGVYGELFLSGIQLARGYFKLPELTESKFISNHLRNVHLDSEYDKRLYRTGDLVRWTANGQVQFLGRRDTQVKIRGNRIELSAIESTLLQDSSVKDAIVIAREDKLGDKILVAYVIPSERSDVLLASTLRAHLSAKLPTFMIPNKFVLMKDFPLTSNHKVNRKALPPPEEVVLDKSPSSPKSVSSSLVGRSGAKHGFLSKIEDSVLDLFAQMLGKPRELITVGADFFQEGGHSLSAARIMSKIRGTFGVDVPLSTFLSNPTVRGLSKSIEKTMKSASWISSRRVNTSQDGVSVGSELTAATTDSAKVRFSMNSIVSSSYRDSTISQWLHDNRTKRRKPENTKSPAEDVSGSYSSSSSQLRKLRAQQERSSMPLDSNAQLSSSVVLPLSIAHSPMWINLPQKQRMLELKHNGLSQRPEVAILSYNQQSLWFLHKINPNRVDFVVHVCVIIEAKEGKVFSAKNFGIALQQLVNTHGSLRTVYGEENGAPYQVIHPPLEELESNQNRSGPNCVDFRYSPTCLSNDELNNSLRTELHTPWDLKTEPPFRARLFVNDNNEHVFLLTAHHIAMDGWSLDIILEDIGDFYDEASFAGGGIVTTREQKQRKKLRASSMSIVEFAKAQKEQMSSATGNRLWNFWQHQLAGHVAFLDIPSDFDRETIKIEGENGDWYHFDIPHEHIEQMRVVMKLERATLFMVLVAFYSALLYRYTGTEDIMIGTPMACRTVPELDRTVGDITNVVVLRMHVGKEDTFRTLLRQARAVVLSAFEHQEFPFAVLVERMSSYRNMSRSPIFQVLLSLNQSFSVGVDEDDMGPSLAQLETGNGIEIGSSLLVSSHPGLEQHVSPYDLQLVFSKSSNEDTSLAGAFQYKTSLFTRETIKNMASHLLALIKSSVDYNKLYSQMPMMEDEEMAKILVKWNDTAKPFNADICIHQLYERQVMKTPFATAVSANGLSWTYHDLNRKANVLARFLRLNCKIEPGCKVGILLKRSPNMVLAYLAVAKSGGTYVPMDISWPKDRLAYVFDDSQMGTVLCDENCSSLVENIANKVAALSINSTWDKIVQYVEGIEGVEESVRNLPPPVSSSWGCDEQQWHGSRSIVYMIYTSGSTGNPKGVLIQHRSLVNLVQWHQETYELNRFDRASQLVGSAFDPAQLEVWPFLTVGASVHIVHSTTRGDIKLLRDFLNDARITVCLLPTPLLEVFLKSFGPGLEWPLSLRVLYGGGDKLHVKSDILASIPFRLDNHYGPSEGTVMCTCFVVNSLKGLEKAVVDPPIGKPINNFAAFVLDQYLRPVPKLVSGELFIMGPGLAEGYFNRRELNHDRFVDIPDHLSGYVRQLGIEYIGTRMYKTGDRVRLSRDGYIEFIGRVDFQVKIRGMRVELGEIESVIQQQPSVMETCVLVREDKPGQQRLCAYCVLTTRTSISGNDQVDEIHKLRNAVKDKLPSYMVPVSWVFLPSLPLTPNGKVDRKSLPIPDERSVDAHGKAMSAVVTPRSAEEVILCNLWKETLGLDTISIHDNFFDLGGHSLAATQLLSAIRDTFHVDIPVSGFFADPSVAGIAITVARLGGGGLNKESQNITEQNVHRDRSCSVEQNLGFDPIAESRLDRSIVALPEALHGRQTADPSKWKTVLLTGANGFLGSFLVKKMYTCSKTLPDLTIVCVIRAANDMQALQKLRDTLFGKYGLFEGATSDDLPVISLFRSWEEEEALRKMYGVTERKRIVVVRGDLALPYLGLEQHSFDSLAQGIDMIFHAGAYVHSLFPYSRLRAANVLGTQEVIRLAFSRRDRLIPLLYVSTLSVFAASSENASDHVFEESGPLTAVKDLHLLEGYAQTKWVAEHLVEEAGSRGLPILIFRPGRITGDSVTGAASFSDFMCLFIKGCIQLQAAPDLHWVMDMNPVDRVCEVMMTLSLKMWCQEQHAFNMCTPNPIYFPEYIEWVNEFGYTCPLIGYEEWREKLIQAVKNQPVAPNTVVEASNAECVENQKDTFDTTSSIASSMVSSGASGNITISTTSRRSSHLLSSGKSSTGGISTGVGERLNSSLDTKQDEDQKHMVNALYPLLPMFAPKASQMTSNITPHFQCSAVTKVYPQDTYSALNKIYFVRMIQQGFLPPPLEDKCDEFFAFE